MILNYNGENLLKENLPALINCLDPKIKTEIIVIDNHSADNSLDYIASAFPAITVLSLDKNYGFSVGMNKGAAIAKNDLLFFLNSDIKPEKGFLTPLLKHFDDPKVFGVSPKVLRPSQNMLNESIITGEFKGGVISAEFSLSQKLKVPDQSFEVFSVCGAAMLIDRRKFFEIGGFDKMLSPFYYEETDLSYRALKHNWKIIYEPGSVVCHMHNQTIGKSLKKIDALISYRKNQYLTVWKNITDPSFLLKHLFQMILLKALIPNMLEWKALFRAIKQLPEAISGRKRQGRLNLLTDKEVFKIASGQIKEIKKSCQT